MPRMKGNHFCRIRFLSTAVVLLLGFTDCGDTSRQPEDTKSLWHILPNMAKTKMAEAMKQAADMNDKGNSIVKIATDRAFEKASNIRESGKRISAFATDRVKGNAADMREGGKSLWARSQKTFKGFAERVMSKASAVREVWAEGERAIGKALVEIQATDEVHSATDRLVDTATAIHESGKRAWGRGREKIREVLSSTGDVPSNSCTDADAECLVEEQIGSIIELRALGMDFYTASAMNAGKSGAGGCIMGGLIGALMGSAAGPLGAIAGATKLCASGGFLASLLSTIEAPFKHWSRCAQAAFRARRAYSVSFVWLDIDSFNTVGANAKQLHDLVNKHFRKCATRYHPDKLPKEASSAHRDSAAVKLANCRFAKAYILAFQKKYGVLDPDDAGVASRKFLESFAGVWAARLGSNNGVGSFSAQQVAEWMDAVKHHAEL